MYLRQTGWTQQELAKRADIDRAVVNRAVKGRRAGKIGELAAMKLERATLDAFQKGETNVAPLRAADLLADAANDADHAKKAG